MPGCYMDITNPNWGAHAYTVKPSKLYLNIFANNYILLSYEE